MISSVGDRGTLYWRRESGVGATEEEALNEVGPAWVIEADGTERKISDGGWITRLEAERLAAAGEYTLDADA
jgi:hypothetical protein